MANAESARSLPVVVPALVPVEGYHLESPSLVNKSRQNIQTYNCEHPPNCSRVMDLYCSFLVLLNQF